MSIAERNDSSTRKPIRLWPGLAGAVAVIVLMVIVPAAMPDALMYGMFGSIAAGLTIGLWWVFFSRAPWAERLGAIAFGIAVIAAMKWIVDPSIAGAGMNMMMPMFGIPVVGVGLVAGAIAGHRLGAGARRAALAIGILLASSTFAVLRTGGISGDGVSDLHWRWTRTAEQRLLAQVHDEPTPAEAPAAPAAPKPADAPAVTVPAATPSEKADAASEDAPPRAPVVSARPAEWPGFRGPDRDSAIHGVQIETDWTMKPPSELWRRAVGPGWSSFAVDGDVFYTQEQRGEDEIVAAYHVSSGEPVWRHRDATRFYESNGGAGPRGTPTLANGRVYTVGATGIVNALDARTGAVVWSRNLGTDAKKPVPGWGFASSPLVIGDLAIVAATGQLVAYDLATGKPRWFGPPHKGGYTSPHRATIDGVDQIMLLTADGITSVSPETGKLLWEHPDADALAPIVQPAMTADGDVLLTNADAMGGKGMKRLAVAHGSGGWTATERWTSTGLKPYFNDYVIHKGHAYGFDNSIMSCVDLADGSRKWKGGRYGHGQVLLLPDEDLLLVLSEEGEIALVSATPEQFKEVARAPAIEGKTWNHPVLVHDVLLVRNGEEMAAFRLSLASR